ncbi:MAG TPA: pyridoxamine 5'-phosphate oxidase family protein [Candidatus Baltobacteraceae bacterium]|nr:pyridoxamine 5'-phosphate oxidase family protein [Candidatus Baltobacteraceae bacterium]
MAGYQSYNDAAKKILEENKYMVLSTSDLDKAPWGSVVFYAYGKNHEFYFFSAVDSRHAKNISANPKIAFVIFDSKQKMGVAESIQAEGKASFVSSDAVLREVLKTYKDIRPSGVSDSELKRVIKTYTMRQFPDSKMDPLKRYPPEEFSEAAELRFYKIKVTKLFLSGTMNRRTEIDLERI